MTARNVDPGSAADRRLRELELSGTARQSDDRGQNRDFTQVYKQGWLRLRELLNVNPTAAKLWAFLAEHIDGSAGAVVVGQEVLAEQLGLSDRTVRRLTKWLEDRGALVRVRVAGTVYAYCLNPEEVWKSWDSAKETAAFHTKTLVKKTDRHNATVRRKLSMMVRENAGEPELPLEEPAKKSTAGELATH